MLMFDQAFGAQPPGITVRMVEFADGWPEGVTDPWRDLVPKFEATGAKVTGIYFQTIIMHVPVDRVEAVERVCQGMRERR